MKTTLSVTVLMAVFSGIAPAQRTPSHPQVIYRNMGNSKTQLYNDVDSDSVGACGTNAPSALGMPFTTKYDSHVEVVRVPVQWDSGANQVNLSIYTDSNGEPGSLLAGPVTITNVPHWGTCCTLDSAIFYPVAVSGGVQYWVVADTPVSGSGSDFCGVWNFVHRSFPTAVKGSNGTWSIVNFPVFELAGEVLGTIP